MPAGSASGSSGGSGGSASIATMRDFLAGTTAGIVAKLLSYPLDTVKVRLQTTVGEQRPTGVGACVRGIWRTEGVVGFYHGIGAPIVGAAMENAFLFGIYANALCAWCRLTGNAPAGATRSELLRDAPLHAVFVGGAVGGIATAHLLTPVELLKCRMQVQHALPPAARSYTGIIDCLVKSVRAEGAGVLYRGHLPMLAREIPGNGAWFVTYELCRSAMVRPGQTRDELAAWQVAVSGGVAGVMYWTAFFPADVAKTRKQTDPRLAGTPLPSVFRAIYREGGVRALYTGWGITVVRAFPMNAVIFLSYNAFVAHWDRWFETVVAPPAINLPATITVTEA